MTTAAIASAVESTDAEVAAMHCTAAKSAAMYARGAMDHAAPDHAIARAIAWAKMVVVGASVGIGIAISKAITEAEEWPAVEERR